GREVVRHPGWTAVPDPQADPATRPNSAMSAAGDRILIRFPQSFSHLSFDALAELIPRAAQECFDAFASQPEPRADFVLIKALVIVRVQRRAGSAGHLSRALLQGVDVVVPSTSVLHLRPAHFTRSGLNRVHLAP